MFKLLGGACIGVRFIRFRSSVGLMRVSKDFVCLPGGCSGLGQRPQGRLRGCFSGMSCFREEARLIDSCAGAEFLLCFPGRGSVSRLPGILQWFRSFEVGSADKRVQLEHRFVRGFCGAGLVLELGRDVGAGSPPFRRS